MCHIIYKIYVINFWTQGFSMKVIHVFCITIKLIIYIYIPASDNTCGWITGLAGHGKATTVIRNKGVCRMKGGMGVGCEAFTKFSPKREIQNI